MRSYLIGENRAFSGLTNYIIGIVHCLKRKCFSGTGRKGYGVRRGILGMSQNKDAGRNTASFAAVDDDRAKIVVSLGQFTAGVEKLFPIVDVDFEDRQRIVSGFGREDTR
mgnify:CR=1 FL=1